MRMAVVGTVAVMAAGLMAEDVTQESFGMLRCSFGGGITVGGLVNFDNWSASAQPVYSASNRTGYVLGSRGEAYANGRWALGSDGAGGVTATNTFTMTRDVKSQAAGTRVYLPFAAFKGAAWRTDTGKSGVFPTNDLRRGLFTGKDVTRVTFATTGGEEISFAFPERRFVHLSNDAAWCDAFSLRLQPPRELKAGDSITDVFTVSVKGRSLTYAANAQTYTVEGKDWVPIKMLKGVQPGGATDFSGWHLQDAPAGKYGWLKRAGGHFEFEGRPAGERVKFCGVNLVGSCCWPEKKQADEIVARLVRSGYNTVRLHHFECDGGITTGTGDPTGTTLNPKRMDQMDYLVAKCIQAGIYVTIDLYSYRTASPEVRAEMWKALGRTAPNTPAFQEMKMLIHLSDAGFENWKAYAGNLLNHVNPYTGRAYKDEPGLPLICLVNEGAPARNWFGGKKVTERECMDVEERSLARMIGFVRSLGAKALITDMNNGPNPPEKMAVREKWLDYFDNHFYIDHPRWLGVRLHVPFSTHNIDIFDYPEGPGMSNADRAAAVRLPTMPYTITEWNFSGPGAFRYQGGLYTAALAVQGRWDGLWRFTYAHGIKNLFDTSKAASASFDVMLDPIQQASERALVALYLRGDATDGENIAKIDHAAKAMSVDTPRTQGGFARAGGGFATSGMDVRLDGAHGAVWATAVDCKPLAESSRILVTHLTDVQNTGVQWADSDRRILLKRGGLPMRARAGTADVSLKVASGPWKAYALGTDGARRGEVVVLFAEGRLRLAARTARDPQNATLLYELVR